MAKDPAFPFYAQDFLSGTAFFTNEETGAYIRLLAHQWNTGQIPKKRLGFVLGSGWESIWENISDKFQEVDGFILNPRLELEREKRAVFKAKQAENGKKGGRPPKKEPKRNPNKTQTITQSKSQKNPLEDENDNESEKEFKKENKKSEKINFPFDSEIFKTQWQLWKVYKSKEFGFKYKATVSENGALAKLEKLSGGDERAAIEIIQQSISEGWKGFFDLKTHPAAKGNTANKFPKRITGAEALQNAVFNNG